MESLRITRFVNQYVQRALLPIIRRLTNLRPIEEVVDRIEDLSRLQINWTND